eukprot:m.156109 g.156109  ORF g.156109 m.156109 type:complete len:273 (-) comp30974_c1_seq8:105-923(-)
MMRVLMFQLLALVATVSAMSLVPHNSCSCTKEYFPVCAMNISGHVSTYGNACMARCANATIMYNGTCSSIPIDPPSFCKGHALEECSYGPAFWCCELEVTKCLCPAWTGPDAEAQLEAFCFGNATTKGYVQKDKNFCSQQCPLAPYCKNNPPTCICPMNYNPVCAKNKNGTRETYSNDCHARCAGATIMWNGTCDVVPDPGCKGHALEECSYGPAFWCCDLTVTKCLCPAWTGPEAEARLEDFCFGNQTSAGYVQTDKDFCPQQCPQAPFCN